MTTTSANPTGQWAAAAARGGRAGSVIAQVKEQRRDYARAVFRALARAQCGQPVAQVQRVLRSALTPLGVRLPPSALRELAAGIATGTPVEPP